MRRGGGAATRRGQLVRRRELLRGDALASRRTQLCSAGVRASCRSSSRRLVSLVLRLLPRALGPVPGFGGMPSAMQPERAPPGQASRRARPFHPPANRESFKDLLIFEERLKQNHERCVGALSLL